MLWFLDRDKKKSKRKNKVLFIDAREIYNQIDRAHREFTPEQIEKLVGIVRSYREEKGAEKYEDQPGLCKVATLDEIRKQDYSLNPGRYVGTNNNHEENEINFEKRVKELTNEFKDLTQEAHELEEKIFENIKKLNL
jgi:type I restriction enzyme M protein